MIGYTSARVDTPVRVDSTVRVNTVGATSSRGLAASGAVELAAEPACEQPTGLVAKAS